MLVDIDKILVSDRIRRDYGDLKELADDITENTLMNPPVVMPNEDGTYTLIAGERRLRAMRDVLGYRQTEVNVVPPQGAERALMMEISENECRKEFTKSERADYIRRLFRIEQAKAKERQTSGTSVENSTEVGRSDEITAAAFGMKKDTMRRELFIADNADLLDPADFESWDEGRLSTNKAFQKVKEAQRKAEQERDEALDELEEAYHSAELMEAEVASLRRQVAEKPQATESEATRKRISDLEHERDIYFEDVQKLRKRNEDMRRELDHANTLIGEKQRDDSAQWDIEALTVATNNYLRQYGGKAWAFDQFYRVDEVTQSEFTKAISNLAAFAQNLAQMIKEQNNE